MAEPDRSDDATAVGPSRPLPAWRVRLAGALLTVAVGLWAGAGAFFNGCVALRIFGYFDGLEAAAPPGMEPLPAELSSRLAGDLIAGVFPTYFGLQIVCGLVAAACACVFAVDGSRGDKWRAGVLMVLLALVVVHVGTLYRWSGQVRQEQYAALDAGDHEAYERHRKRFFALHGPSLLLDMATTLAVVGVLGSLGWRRIDDVVAELPSVRPRSVL